MTLTAAVVCSVEIKGHASLSHCSDALKVVRCSIIDGVIQLLACDAEALKKSETGKRLTVSHDLHAGICHFSLLLWATVLLCSKSSILSHHTFVVSILSAHSYVTYLVLVCLRLFRLFLTSLRVL